MSSGHGERWEAQTGGLSLIVYIKNPVASDSESTALQENGSTTKSANQELFQRFGRLDTWIAGIQYYNGAEALDSPDVFFERDLDNPCDPNAVAVLAGAFVVSVYAFNFCHKIQDSVFIRVNPWF